MKRHLLLKIIWSLLGIFVAISGISLLRFNQALADQPIRWGVSFSTKYARELKLDWQQAYLYLLDEAGARRLRLMSYWDALEPQPGRYDFSELDWQLDQAASRGAEVTLAIGMRQPRWPECHRPQWAAGLPESDQEQAIQRLITRVVDRYKDRSHVISWQLENEALNGFFGECQKARRDWLVQEAALVKRLDPQRPLVMTLSDEVGWPLGQPRPDQYGFSVYRRYFESNWAHRYLTYPLTPLFHRWRAAMVYTITGRLSFIHELQAEPWGPKPTVELSLAEQGESMSAERLVQTLEYARQTGMKDIYLWGGEWWYWRQVRHGDYSLTDIVRQTFKPNL